jgi:hypothetical protein
MSRLRHDGTLGLPLGLPVMEGLWSLTKLQMIDDPDGQALLPQRSSKGLSRQSTMNLTSHCPILLTMTWGSIRLCQWEEVCCFYCLQINLYRHLVLISQDLSVCVILIIGQIVCLAYSAFYPPYFPDHICEFDRILLNLVIDVITGLSELCRSNE